MGVLLLEYLLYLSLTKKEDNPQKFNPLLIHVNMKTNIPNLGECSIDSFKLRIELSSLISYDKTLNENLITLDAETCSTIEREFKRQSKKYFLDGFSIYASISEKVRVSNDRFADCLTVLINSKQLGSRYFEGITIDNLPVVFDMIKSVGILNCSYDVFIDSSPTDVDFKKDYEVVFDEYKEVVSSCRIMTKTSTDRDIGCTPFTSKDNYGISWSVRTTSKYLTNPYTKIYHKGLEFIKESEKGGSKDFKDKYLSSVDTSNVIRIETTIKNKKHLGSLKIGLVNFSLRELLSLTSEQKDQILSKAVNSHLLPRTNSLSFKTESKMTPSNRIYLNLLMGLVSDSNFTFKRALNLALNGIENDSSKSKNKKVLTRLYNDHLKGTDYEKKSSNVENILDGLGWF